MIYKKLHFNISFIHQFLPIHHKALSTTIQDLILNLFLIYPFHTKKEQKNNF
jgi:hypothetical protein